EVDWILRPAAGSLARSTLPHGRGPRRQQFRIRRQVEPGLLSEGVVVIRNIRGALLPSTGGRSAAAALRVGTGRKFAGSVRRDPLVHDIGRDGRDWNVIGAAVWFGRQSESEA